jgi:hypothetical protein
MPARVEAGRVFHANALRRIADGAHGPAVCLFSAQRYQLLVLKSGYDVHGDLAYGADLRQKLGTRGSSSRASAAVLLWGGYCSSDNRADYRLYPQVTYPALRWTR